MLSCCASNRALDVSIPDDRAQKRDAREQPEALLTIENVIVETGVRRSLNLIRGDILSRSPLR